MDEPGVYGERLNFEIEASSDVESAVCSLDCDCGVEECPAGCCGCGVMGCWSLRSRNWTGGLRIAAVGRTSGAGVAMVDMIAKSSKYSSSSKDTHGEDQKHDLKIKHLFRGLCRQRRNGTGRLMHVSFTWI